MNGRGSSFLRQGVIGLVASLALAAAPASAQRSKDTVRTVLLFALQTLDTYTESNPETTWLEDAVFDNLLSIDLKSGKVQPLLAKSWTRKSPTVLELDLRNDVTWHDGHKFDADDVVYTLGWLIDPKVNLRFKDFWAWIDHVEKLGPYKVRIVAKAPTPYDLMRLGFQTPIYPRHVHQALANKADFGRNPVGTGPYKVAQLELNKGLVLVKNRDYKLAGVGKAVPNFERFEATVVPELGTQLSHLYAGNLDVLRVTVPDVAQQLQSNRPELTRTVVQTFGMHVIYFPSSGLKLNKALGDVRVRRAIRLALNRGELEKVTSGDIPLVMNVEGLCWRSQAGCGFSKAQPGYDPQEAKKLLAEAGYPNGLDVEITALGSPSVKAACEAIAAQLQAVGVRARINALPISLYRKTLAEGNKIEIAVEVAGPGTIPDVSSWVSQFYLGDQFAAFPTVKKLAQQTMTQTNDGQRRKTMAQLNDTLLDNALFYPLSSLTFSFFATKDVSVKVGGLSTRSYGAPFDAINWVSAK